MILIDEAGHLISDRDIQELHIFAQGMGLKREWFQDKRLPHYDVTTNRMRAKAIKHGALLINSKEIVKALKNMHQQVNNTQIFIRG